MRARVWPGSFGGLAAVVSVLGVAALAARATLDVRPLEASKAPTPSRNIEPVATYANRILPGRAVTPAPRTVLPRDSLAPLVRLICGECHNDSFKMGQLSLEHFELADAVRNRPLAEKMITKLRAGTMPAPEFPMGADSVDALATELERLSDSVAARNPEPGRRMFQRLNRAEYESSIRNLLELQVDAGMWLPLDTKSANFDNIADVQLPSVMVLDAYLEAASAISRLAVGDPNATAQTVSYKVPRIASQVDQVPGAPAGTRGGLSVVHNFVADGEYVFRIDLQFEPTGELFGWASPFPEKLEIAIDGARVATLEIDRAMTQSDPNGLVVTTPAIPVRAGPRRVSATFPRTFEGPVNENLSPHGHSIADTQIGTQHAITALPHLTQVSVQGPHNPTGVSETASRRRIFTCRPLTAAEGRTCAASIIRDVGGSAYRRPLTPGDVEGLLEFYDRGTSAGGFELGIRTALEAILSSPHFFLRVEELPLGARPGGRYSLNDIDLASRLSFFLWGEPPDATLIGLAQRRELRNPAVLQAQTRRMVADPRSQALATRFAAQWLRLQDLEKVHPDANLYPDFHKQLADDMQRETELFFYGLIQENRNVLDLVNADYSYLNERLADHYSILGVAGQQFRRVTLPDSLHRGGVLGQGSILTLTSQASRTSPVLRGKWVMEVLLGSPPPPPPPNVPDLEKTKGASDGRSLTTRERLEMHRDDRQCRSCHVYMDPIGLALDNFDVMGQWRERENGERLDTRGELYDGTPVSSLRELQQALMRRPTPILRNFTLNLMAYALGRRIEYYDQPAIRKIVRDAKPGGYRMNDMIMGVVLSDAFRTQRIPETASSAPERTTH